MTYTRFFQRDGQGHGRGCAGLFLLALEIVERHGSSGAVQLRTRWSDSGRWVRQLNRKDLALDLRGDNNRFRAFLFRTPKHLRGEGIAVMRRRFLDETVAGFVESLAKGVKG